MFKKHCLALPVGLLLALLHAAVAGEAEIEVARTGTVRAPVLNEMSGLQASRRQGGVLWTHNDDGPAWLHAIDAEGHYRGHVEVTGARNRDWEDLALLPAPEQDLLVIGDFGEARPADADAVLYVVPEPVPDGRGLFGGEVAVRDTWTLQFPGPREDIESMAWDPLAQRLLLLAKRSRPPRLYAVDPEQARESGLAEMRLLGTVDVLRPPQGADQRKFGKRTHWISQPTGMDIAPDGRRAAIITYRSLYLFQNMGGGDWAGILQTAPTEIIGPPADQEEAVAFLPDGRSLVVTTEGNPAPIYTYRLE